jgi:bacillithiol biosynthesis deacetylase BshB1
MSESGCDVLAFGPHPDDVELFCGGTLLRMRELGHRTAIVDLTRGERASHGTPEERAAEARAASEIMQLTFRENLGLPDTGLDPSSREQLEAVVCVLRRHRPELVLAPFVEERHPDHVATSELVTKAVFFAGLRNYELASAQTPRERFVPHQVLYYAMRYRMTPSFVVDTSSVWELKERAIQCHASQLERPDRPSRTSNPPTLIGAAGALEALRARDAYYGSMIGTRYGEPLRSAGVLGLIDPVAHFRDNPFRNAHAFEAPP